MPKVTDSHREEMRNRLVDAAVTVINREGSSAATTRRILEEAGLSNGALYHYFSGKSELFSAIGNRMAAQTHLQAPEPDTAISAEATVQNQVEMLRQLFDPLHLGASELNNLRDQASHDDNVADSLREFDRGVVERFAPSIAQARQVGIYRQGVDPEALVELIQVLFEGFESRGRSTGFVTSRKEVLEVMLTMLNDGILDSNSPHAESFRELTKDIAR